MVTVLLGESNLCEDGSYYLPLGGPEFQDYTIMLPDSDDGVSLSLIIENGIVRFDGSSRAPNITNLRIYSYTGDIIYQGGANIDSLEIFTNYSFINTPGTLGSIRSVTKNKLTSSDYQIISKLLPGICFGHGTGDSISSPRSASSLDEMKLALPSVGWVNIPVIWAATTKDLKTCCILPGIEKPEEALSWPSAHMISRITDGSVNFGRSYLDPEVLNIYDTAKAKGLKTCFMPSLLVDDLEKSWRGFITGSADAIENWFEEQYYPFILHYAYLLKGKVDAFIIGSELKGITSISMDGVFLAIDCLIKLAEQVKGVLGNEVTITYAANWDEYHHGDGGSRHLDWLWASPAIDVVGINAYFPLTDKKSGKVIKEDVIYGWTSGEAYEYYVDGTGTHQPLTAEWAVKNISYWHGSEHWSSSGKTPWSRCMKPLWLTELGFASIDKTSNEPNLYGKSPRYSSGQMAIDQQLACYAGSLEFLSSLSFVQNVFAYQFDPRGTGWHKEASRWADRISWYTGHSLDGKLPS